MKFVTIADTHGKHDNVILPPGDVLIHAGDVSMRGAEIEIVDFLNWFGCQNFEYKVLIAGNHDFYFEREPDQKIKEVMPDGIIYLQDGGTVINNINLWGSPVTPWFFNWAFNRHRGAPIKSHWDLIPADTDILITHGPMFGTLDSNKKGAHLGCKDLFDKVNEVKPRVHICGHIHEAYGTINKSGTRFINASVLNEKYELTNGPIVFEL